MLKLVRLWVGVSVDKSDNAAEMRVSERMSSKVGYAFLPPFSRIFQRRYTSSFFGGGGGLRANFVTTELADRQYSVHRNVSLFTDLKLVEMVTKNRRHFSFEFPIFFLFRETHCANLAKAMAINQSRLFVKGYRRPNFLILPVKTLWTRTMPIKPSPTSARKRVHCSRYHQVPKEVKTHATMFQRSGFHSPRQGCTLQAQYSRVEHSAVKVRVDAAGVG